MCFDSLFFYLVFIKIYYNYLKLNIPVLFVWHTVCIIDAFFGGYRFKKVSILVSETHIWILCKIVLIQNYFFLNKYCLNLLVLLKITENLFQKKIHRIVIFRSISKSCQLRKNLILKYTWYQGLINSANKTNRNYHFVTQFFLYLYQQSFLLML